MKKDIKYKVIKPIFNTEIRYIDDVKGYGVFTNEFIPKYSIVEICYCIDVGMVNNIHSAYDYLFYDTLMNKNLLPFGTGAVYNHSKDANLEWKITDHNKNIMEIYSIKDINPNDEMCHNYGEKYWKARAKKLL
jgi:hypothetical protein